LENKAFSLTKEETKDIEKLKEAMCTTLILVVTDFTKTFILECDASRHGIRAVLMQEGRPLAFET